MAHSDDEDIMEMSQVKVDGADDFEPLRHTQYYQVPLP
jgi:hypothetical protein